MVGGRGLVMVAVIDGGMSGWGGGERGLVIVAAIDGRYSSWWVGGGGGERASYSCSY